MQALQDSCACVVELAAIELAPNLVYVLPGLPGHVVIELVVLRFKLPKQGLAKAEKWLYLDKRENDWMNKSRPCQFLDLKTNMCSVYAVRPADCAGFPHLVKKPLTDYMYVHKQNIEYCPATLLFVEKIYAATKA